MFWLVVAGYHCDTLFTHEVELRGAAFNVYPWKTLQRPVVQANTGIVFTQLGPWTEAARQSLRHGELPVWNRFAACGGPLLANQQTALFHPFTLLGLPLTLGKSFTLTACLRLFFVLFFTFVFLQRWELDVLSSLYGALAYAFCTFHIIWLLFPLGLATMMLPLVLSGIDELSFRPSAVAALPLVVGVAATLFGGHPESAAWVLVTGGAYAIYASRPYLAYSATAIVAGIALSAVAWYPTWVVLPFTSRGALIAASHASTVHHHYSAEWFLPLIAPNILGTSQTNTYHAPQPANADLLDDYGEVASAYAGAISLAFAFVTILQPHRKPRMFFIAVAAFALLTVFDPPLWHTALSKVPLIGMTLFPRVRFLIALSIAVLAALGVNDWRSARATKTTVVLCLLTAIAAIALAYGSHLAPPGALREVQLQHVAVAAATIVAATVCALRPNAATTIGIVAAVVCELMFVTRGYNHASQRRDIYPETGAIAFLERRAPSRFAAFGWSFLAETPAAYGIEDIKTTDPFAHRDYQRVLGKFSRSGDYDHVIQDFANPWLNFLGVRYFYVPADQHLDLPWLREVYSGADGRVFENTRALPRYYSVNDVIAVPHTWSAIDRVATLPDLRYSAIVSNAPEPHIYLQKADVSLIRYRSNTTELHVHAVDRGLIVTSDVAWPGWNARWNGASLPLVTVNGLFVGVFVPAGNGMLRLEYQAPGLMGASIVSAVTALLIAIAVAVSRAT